VTLFYAIILGIIQGITEFLPISSSGHLTLAQYFLGLEDLEQFITFDLVCHLGTLLAIVVVYPLEIKSLLSGRNRTCLYQIVLGTLPLFPIVLILKPIENLFDKPNLLGFFYFITAALLFAGIRWGFPKPENERRKRWWQDALAIGCFQALAILPGVSRSGATISGARLLGWDKLEAVTFSFLLAIPAILGGTALKLLQMYALGERQGADIPFFIYAAGFITSFIVGYFALLLLIRLASKEKFMYFVWYCLLLGLAISSYFYIGKGWHEW
jgi:undecaprenyl-diphosphatase